MKPFLIVSVLFLSNLFIGHGQEKAYRFKHLNNSDGLSQSSVINIAQDRLGRMWLGTRDGLNLYDGNNFKVYRNEPNNTSSISNSDILAIMEDSDGFIWVGTYNGLNRYDPEKDSFVRYFHSNNENALSNNTVWCITEVANGDIWIGTSNGLSIYHKDSDSFTTLYAGDADTALPSNYILSIAESNNGRIWVGTSKGFCKVTKKGSAPDISFKSLSPKSFSAAPFVQVISVCDENRLCIGTKNMGLLQFDLISERFLIESPLGNDQDVRAITIDTDGVLWAGTADGLTLFDRQGNIQKLTNNPNEDSSLSHNYIKSLFTDQKGSVWVGSYYGGVDIWDESNSNFVNFGEFSEKVRLGHKVVSSIVVDAQKNRYFGTEGGGITIVDHTGLDTRYLDVSNAKALESNNIKSLFINDDLLLIGTFNKGLKVYDIKKQRFDASLLSDSLQTQLSNTGVYAIKKEQPDKLWIGTFGDGLIRYDISQKSYSAFRNKLGDTSGLSSNRIRSLMIDNASNVWVGTQSGLNLLPFSNGSYSSDKITQFFYESDTGSGDDVLAIFQDSGGSIWVGLRAKGLFRFDGNTFQHVPIKTEKMITSIYAILEDEERVLWLSSNQGLIRYETKNDAFAIYTQKDGLVGNEFTSGAALKLSESTFYFGGPAGVSSFDSNNIVKNDFAPQVLLTDLTIKNEAISPKDSTGILTRSVPFTKEVVLAYDNANFSIAYAIPNFINPGSNLYQYRMVGLEENWTITDQTQANYTIQKPGDYFFEVKGANNDGVWNSEPTTLKIIVNPAPWRSSWAFFTYALLILSAVWGLGSMIRSRTKLRHKLQLEHLENERNQEINDAKLRFFTNISHEFRTPLTLITGPLQQLLADYKGSSFVYKKLLVIESNANHLLQLINRLMDFRKLEHNRYQLEAAEGNIVKFLREVYLSFTEFAKGNGFEYTFHSDEDEILVYYDRSKLEQVFYNVLSNAFKYTPPNERIAVNVKKESDRIIIEVVDTGPGIPEAYRNKVFDRFFEIPDYKYTANGQGAGTGIGLSIAKNIVVLHKGTITAIGNPEKGSTFSVSLPLGKEHLGEEQLIKNFKFSDDLGLYTSQLLPNTLEDPIKANELLIDHEKDTVLLVEDNVPLRSFMRDLLKDTYQVLEAGDGQEGIKKALQHLPDLIVSDVIMPVMVGTELCAKIKENIKTSHIPVVLLTSRTSLLYKFEGLESGADDYISKPFNVREFKLRIKNLIDSSKRLRTKFSEEHSFTTNEIAITSIDEKLLKKALQIVEDNIANDQFDIPTFSSELGVSRTLLFTKVKAWTNFTPNEFIQEIRMKRAAQLLEKDKLNISQISYAVGFKNPKYFSKCFQKKFGVPPSYYLEKFSENF